MTEAAPTDPDFHEQAAGADRVITAGLHFLTEEGSDVGPIMSGAIAAMVRFYIDRQTEAGVPVTVRDLNTAFFKSINSAAEQVIHGAAPEKVN